ncbi:MAG TPA: HAMP domain-containing sensor histidine kinase [Gemmatimonas sp.]|nr:HAMP domain-containing sensor histidine kinase [Gemmatimonas sp.]
MQAARRTLRARLLTVFIGFTVIVVLVFGLSATVFVYAVEDDFFSALLEEEGTRLEQERARATAWGVPRQPWMSVHASTEVLPQDLRDQVASAPRRREFRGDAGRHYHLRVLQAASAPNATSPTWLVAEVSSRLVVRPMRASLIETWLMVGTVILLLSIALALWLARRITKPLSVLVERVSLLHPTRPSPSFRILGADGEVEMVSRALEAMRTRVDAFVEREQSFTRDASHELRTPLSVIRSATAQALDDPALAPTSRRLLGLALQSAKQMERTVASLLALTREDVEAPGEPTEVLPVLEAVVIEQCAVLDGRDLTLRIDVPQRAALTVSSAVLHLVLSNMIGNAIAHASRGPIGITFTGRCLTVRNPVEAASLPSIGTLGRPWVKGAASRGSGLGLVILQRLCARARLGLEWQVLDGHFVTTVHDGDGARSSRTSTTAG